MSTSKNPPIFAQGRLAELVARSKGKPGGAGKVMAGYQRKDTGEFLPLGEVDVTEATFDELCRECGHDPIQVAQLSQAMASGRQAAQASAYASLASRTERLGFARGYLEIMLQANPMERAQAILREAVAAKGWPTSEADEVVAEFKSKMQQAASTPAPAPTAQPSPTQAPNSNGRAVVPSSKPTRGAPPAPAAAARVEVTGRKWEDLSNIEKHNLAHQDRAAFDALHDDYVRRNTRIVPKR